MSGFTKLDLSKVPVPDIIKTLDFEQEYEQLKAQFLLQNPQYQAALSLESDPVSVLLQTLAYQHLLQKQSLNDAIKGNMLASAQGHDLDAIAARYNLARKASPEESDAAFRQRIQLAFDGLNTAGSRESYIYHTMSCDALIKDVAVQSPKPCDIELTILSQTGSGMPESDLIAKVEHYFAAQGSAQSSVNDIASKVRPLGDRVTVHKAQIVPFVVKAELSILHGPSGQALVLAAEKAVADYCQSRHYLGKKVTRAGIYAALHQSGVEDVTLLSPVEDIVTVATQAPFCESISVTMENVYE
ncbi:baseplate assembly protein [Pseudoalteromonas obscura]|uniref:Baseplate J/gp47 family protein n=1 Tax=Pseudoalteromonas obscura TaxID=3048491 RepID=A0ABT7EHW5_9GAMM|nr:baseplate J/gp47 family protein [Pseudoalteromonas sp. P94(2023)]MDK2594643.1 baseplate J/gp47 family protein [Pseudoalteromonas sp. P94(2023)]